LRKLLIIGAMLALVALVAAPAMAQDFDFDGNDFDDDGGRAFFFGDDNDDNDDFEDFFFGNDNDNDLFDNGFFDNGFEQETDETGDVTLDTSIVNTGNNSNQCVAPLQFGNTGNNQNEQGFVSFGSSNNGFFDDNNGFFDFNNDFDTNLDDVEFEGSTFEFAPEQAVQCDQAVEQAAASSG
jgi:hypothetical protein